jgi:hypothetical protein
LPLLSVFTNFVFEGKVLVAVQKFGRKEKKKKLQRNKYIGIEPIYFGIPKCYSLINNILTITQNTFERMFQNYAGSYEGNYGRQRIISSFMLWILQKMSLVFVVGFQKLLILFALLVVRKNGF